MTKLVTSKGYECSPDWLFEHNNTVFFRVQDKRAMSLVVAEFEGCENLHYECDYYDPADYRGYTEVKEVRRDDDGKVNVLLAQ